MPNTDTTYVSPGEAAHRLNRNPRTIVRWAEGLGEPDVITTPGGHRRIATHIVEQWATEQQAVAS